MKSTIENKPAQEVKEDTHRQQFAFPGTLFDMDDPAIKKEPTSEVGIPIRYK